MGDLLMQVQIDSPKHTIGLPSLVPKPSPKYPTSLFVQLSILFVSTSPSDSKQKQVFPATFIYK